MTRAEYYELPEEEYTKFREDPKNYVFSYHLEDGDEFEDSEWWIGLRIIFEEGFMDDGWMAWPYNIGLTDESECIFCKNI